MCVRRWRTRPMRRAQLAKFIIAWDAAPRAAAAREPSAASWMKRSLAPLRRAIATLHSSSSLYFLGTMAGLAGGGGDAAFQHARPRATLVSPATPSCGITCIAGASDERRAWSRRLPQQGPAPRTDRGQSVLAALPAARQLGLQVARQAMAQRIARGDAARRQAGRAHHLSRRLPQHAGARSAAYRTERQRGARLRSRRRIARACALRRGCDPLPCGEGLRFARPVREADARRGEAHRFPRNPARPCRQARSRTLRAAPHRRTRRG